MQSFDQRKAQLLYDFFKQQNRNNVKITDFRAYEWEFSLTPSLSLIMIIILLRAFQLFLFLPFLLFAAQRV